MRQNGHSTKMYVVHRNTLLDSFRVRIVWFQSKQDSDRIQISFFKNRIGSDSKNPLSDRLCFACVFPFPHACLPNFFTEFNSKTKHIGKALLGELPLLQKNFDNEVLRGFCVFYFSLCL